VAAASVAPTGLSATGSAPTDAGASLRPPSTGLGTSHRSGSVCHALCSLLTRPPPLERCAMPTSPYPPTWPSRVWGAPIHPSCCTLGNTRTGGLGQHAARARTPDGAAATSKPSTAGGKGSQGGQLTPLRAARHSTRRSPAGSVTGAPLHGGGTRRSGPGASGGRPVTLHARPHVSSRRCTGRVTKGKGRLVSVCRT
jgi:hypothetical protein